MDKISKYSNLFKNRETEAFICCQQVHATEMGRFNLGAGANLLRFLSFFKAKTAAQNASVAARRRKCPKLGHKT